MRSEKGFTLLELMVTVAIVGILASLSMQAFAEYRKRAYEVSAMHYLRNWVPAQELHLQVYGKYADADEQLAEDRLKVLWVPRNVPYDFSIDSSSVATEEWWGRALPQVKGLRHFCINQSGRLTSSFNSINCRR